MSYKYILIDKQNDYNDKYDGYYLSYTKSVNLIKKYESYIFKCKSDKDIIYLNHPLKMYYSCSEINNIDDENKEEDITSFSYIEVRLTDKYPSIRVGVLDI